jgi:hypothetical protein
MPVVSKMKDIYQSVRSWSLYKLYCRYCNVYLAMVTATALLGYLYILLFPAGIIYGIWRLYDLFPAPLNVNTLLSASIWLAVSLTCALITHGIFTIRFKDPEGIALPREKARLIYQKLDEIQKGVKWPRIDNVVLTRRFELNIIKTPIRGTPLWSRTTLVIGVPFMQSLSPEQFDCALTRKVLQFSKRRNIFFNWLSFLRTTWMLYPDAFKKRRNLGDQVSRWFFHFYSRFYRYLALYATQLDELHADALALNTLNDRDLFRTIETIRLAQIFLNQHYWPKINELVSRQSIAVENIRPYDHLSKSVIQALDSPRIEHWLKMLSLEKDSKSRHEPPFARRMEFMGYNKIVAVKPFARPAAEYYLGTGYQPLIRHMNQLWARNIGNRPRRNRRHKPVTSAQQSLNAAY